MIDVEWSQIKEYIARKNSPLGWINRGSYYIVRTVDSIFDLQTRIDITEPANADQIDFETNYKV